MLFYPGLHQPSDAKHFRRAFISVNRLLRRRKGVEAEEWIMDSGAFTQLARLGCYPPGYLPAYASSVLRWKGKSLMCAVTQDYMCEPFMLAKTGLTLEEHQRFTIYRYKALCRLCPGVYIMPVLQGFTPADYVRHIDMYEAAGLLPFGAYVGVGSICKRNTDVGQIVAILEAIKTRRTDLFLHGFGLKLTALACKYVRDLLHSADSMAWSFSARKARRAGDETRSSNDWREAKRFEALICDFEHTDQPTLFENAV